MTQDFQGRIFIAEQTQDITEIYMLTLRGGQVQKEKIFQLNDELAALDSDNSL